ncbi:TPA: hypothetical protein DEP86_03560, partial [Candidatus Uhrbacteria bacterium]|nr:hypothetical protein [Candidatus Uhrbacteria bacterium]
MNFRKHRKKLIIGLVIAAALIILVMIMLGRKPQVEFETYTVDHGDVVEIISATGSIAPSSKIQLQPEVA